MSTSNKRISAAIKKLTGIPDVKVFCSGGCGRFYSDAASVSYLLESLSTDTIYCHALRVMTAKEWAVEFESNINSDFKRGLVKDLSL